MLEPKNQRDHTDFPECVPELLQLAKDSNNEDQNHHFQIESEESLIIGPIIFHWV